MKEKCLIMIINNKTGIIIFGGKTSLRSSGQFNKGFVVLYVTFCGDEKIIMLEIHIQFFNE